MRKIANSAKLSTIITIMIRNTLLRFFDKDSHLADLAKDSHLAEGSHLAASLVPLPILLGKLGRFLFFLAAAGFLLIALTACAGGSGDSSAGDSPKAIQDDDNDGIENDLDNCPMDANTDQLDTDDDKVGDACDEDDDGDGVRDGVEAAGCALAADCDNDGARDGADVDDDGDGLIEIGTAAELDAVRYALNGSGRRSLRNGVLNTDGCGNGTTASCSGYELVTDISLAAYANNEGGKGWQPLGHDTNSVIDRCQGAAFNGIFEGNGWTITDLSINRPTEDCVGLFGQMAVNSEIRNLTVRAEAVVGRNIVGGLVGSGDRYRIISSSVVAAKVSGSTTVGGLVGFGPFARVHSSSVVAAEVSGVSNSVGGLLGSGEPVRIHSSSVVVGVVSGNNFVGGLVGVGESAGIISSSVVAGEVSGRNTVGGLVGDGRSAQIRSSSVVVGKVSETASFVGGLVGAFTGQLAYSYVVSGSNVNMLAGISSGTRVASYWDSDTSGFTSGGNLGTPKTSDALRSPTDYEGIYDDWNKTNIFGGDEPLAVWCDRDNSGNITGDEKVDANLIWDFGESDEYPAIRCTPLKPDDWRDWWSLNATDKPELDRDRLDEALNQ